MMRSKALLKRIESLEVQGSCQNTFFILRVIENRQSTVVKGIKVKIDDETFEYAGCDKRDLIDLVYEHHAVWNSKTSYKRAIAYWL